MSLVASRLPMLFEVFCFCSFGWFPYLFDMMEDIFCNISQLSAALEEWRKRKMERARQRELGKNGTATSQASNSL